MRHLFLLLLAVAAASVAAREGHAAEKLRVTEEADGVTVWVGDEVFTRYLKRSGTRPILWPVYGPNGAAMTRSYPVGDLGPYEETDHPHHRSIWIGYEGVNGFDFWHQPETERDRHFPPGTQRHREFVRADSTGKVATVGARNDWLAPDGSVVAHDERLLEFRAGDGWRAIDFLIDLWSSDGPLELGDTKEGFFALRVPGTMKIDAGLGGEMVNSVGQRNSDAWGQPAAWIDYRGPVGEQQAGVAIFTHPKNERPDPRWHARPYGLLAVNPFGVVPYGGDAAEETPGLRLEEGERRRLRYRVWLHDGESTTDELQAAFDAYAKKKIK